MQDKLAGRVPVTDPELLDFYERELQNESSFGQFLNVTDLHFIQITEICVSEDGIYGKAYYKGHEEEVFVEF